MGFLKKIIGSFISSKKEESDKAQKISELKESRINESRNLEKGLDNFVKFIDEYDEDRVDIETQIEEIKKHVQPAVNWNLKYNKIIGTYKIKNIDLEGFYEFQEKYNFVTIYLNYEKNITECRLAFVGLRDIWNIKIKEIKSKNRDKLEDFEEKCVQYELLSMQTTKTMAGYLNDVIDLEKNVKCSSDYKDIIVGRLKKELFDTHKIGEEECELSSKVVQLYGKEKKKADPTRERKKFGGEGEKAE